MTGDVEKSPLEITDDILTALRDETTFVNKVRQHHTHEGMLVAYEPIINDDRLKDAWSCYRKGEEQMKRSLHRESREADHFKRSGLLVFWLRRASPIIGLERKNSKHPPNEKLATMLEEYPSELLAFGFGLAICNFYESEKEGAAPLSRGKGDTNLIDMDEGYIQTVCYMMKFKNLSPHSMGLIYRSLYTNPYILPAESAECAPAMPPLAIMPKAGS